jgi:diphosphoinositol-polyphosphate diphosphatase
LIGYGSSGERLVAGVVCLSADKRQVLLVQSSQRTNWVLPKGGWEIDEPTAQDGALREAWEEAGVTGRDIRPLAEIADLDGSKSGSKKPDKRKQRYYFFEMVLETIVDVYPESDKRQRCWCGFPEAREALKGKPFLVEALEKSTIIR